MNTEGIKGSSPIETGGLTAPKVEAPQTPMASALTQAEANIAQPHSVLQELGSLKVDDTTDILAKAQADGDADRVAKNGHGLIDTAGRSLPRSEFQTVATNPDAAGTKNEPASEDKTRDPLEGFTDYQRQRVEAATAKTQTETPDSKVHDDLLDDDLKPVELTDEAKARLYEERQDLGMDQAASEDQKSTLDQERQDLGVDNKVNNASKLAQLRENARLGRNDMPPPDATPDAPWGKYPDGSNRPNPSTLPPDGSAQGIPPERTRAQKALDQEKADLGIVKSDSDTSSSATEAPPANPPGWESVGKYVGRPEDKNSIKNKDGTVQTLDDNIGPDVTDEAIRRGAEENKTFPDATSKEAYIAKRIAARDAARTNQGSGTETSRQRSADNSTINQSNDNTARNQENRPINYSTDNTGDLQKQREADAARGIQPTGETDTAADRVKKAQEAKEAEKAEKAAKAREADLKKRFESGDAMTAAEVKEHLDNESKKPEITGDRKQIEDQMAEMKKNKDNWTDEDMQKYAELTSQLNEIKQSEKSPEDLAKEQLQQIEDIGTEALTKMLSGEDATDEITKYNKLVAESMGFTIAINDEKLAREFMKGVFNPDKIADVKESARMKAIKEKLQELAQLEMRIQGQVQIVKQMEKQEKNYAAEQLQAEADYVNEKDPAEKQKKLMAYTGKTLTLTKYRDAIQGQKNLGRDAVIQRRDVRGFIHRKLGTHNALYNVAFGLGTTALQAANGALDNFDSLVDLAS